MFERTKSGQQNRAIFFNVDYICYVEGGDSGNSGEKYSADITFWAGVFSVSRPDLRIKCVPKGGKPILESLARDIMDKNLSGTLVAMDSDYDHVTGDYIRDTRVLYTYGYSWENDAFDIGNMHLVYAAICHYFLVPAVVRSFLEQNITRLHNQLRWPVRADYLALIAGSSILPRKNPGRVVKTGVDGLPFIDRAEILKLCMSLRKLEKPRRTTVSPISQIGRSCVGHIYQLAIIYLFKAAVRMFHHRKSLATDHIRDIVLQTLPSFLEGDPDHLVAQHHNRQCSVI